MNYKTLAIDVVHFSVLKIWLHIMPIMTQYISYKKLC